MPVPTDGRLFVIGTPTAYDADMTSLHELEQAHQRAAEALAAFVRRSGPEGPTGFAQQAEWQRLRREALAAARTLGAARQASTGPAVDRG